MITNEFIENTVEHTVSYLSLNFSLVCFVLVENNPESKKKVGIPEKV